MGAFGEVASAQYARRLWEVARLVRDNPTVCAEFDHGVAGLLQRLDDVPDADEFRAAFAQFIADYGHRGPNDWEISSRTWENTPELALAAIDRMRMASTTSTLRGASDSVEQAARRGRGRRATAPEDDGQDQLQEGDQGHGVLVPRARRHA